MPKENASLDFRQKIDKTRSCLLEERKHNDLISEKHKKFCRALNMLTISYLLFLFSAASCCFSIFAFALLNGVPVDIASSEGGSKMHALIAEIKKYKSIIRKKRKKHNEIVFLTKYYLFYFWSLKQLITLQKKRSYPLKIFSVNVTKSEVSCGFGHIYGRNP